MEIPEYDKLWQQRLMLEDRERNEAFKEAIGKIVKPGDVVLDMGAGTGFLSILSAQAGARKVYAIEVTKMAQFAQELAQKNGCADQIEVIQSQAQNATIPEKVDVIVSEWLGSYAIDENLLEPLIGLRNRWLKPGGKMIPQGVTIWMAPVWDKELFEHIGFWGKRRQGVDLSLLQGRLVHEPKWTAQNILPHHLLADPEKLWDLNMNELTAEEASSVFESTVSFRIRKPGKLNGLALWFLAEMGEGVQLSNAPDRPWTHWGRFVLPLSGARPVTADNVLSVRFVSEPAGGGRTRQIWSARIDDEPWEHHDSQKSEL